MLIEILKSNHIIYNLEKLFSEEKKITADLISSK